MLTRRIPRTTQPQGALQINLSAPYSSAIVALLPLSADDPRDLVSGNLLTMQSGGSVGVDPSGLSLRGAGSACASIPLDLTAHSQITLSLWLWWDAWANNDALAMEFVAPNFYAANGFLLDPNDSGTAGFSVAAGAPGVAAAKWFSRPSAAAWHHYMIGVDRDLLGGVSDAYVDGVPQSLKPQASGTAGGKFAAATLYLFSRANTSLFGAGRMQNLVIRAGLPTQELAQWEYAHPWELFAPLSTHIPTSAAGGLPTISSMTYVPGSITSSGFRPRMVVT